MKISTVVKILVPLLVLIGVVFYLFEGLKPTATVVEVERSDAIRSVSGTVRVMATKAMALKSEEGGRILESRLEVGIPVNKGDVLVKLDTADLDLEIEQVNIDLDAAKKMRTIGSSHKQSLVSAKEALEDSERMFSLGSASSSQVEDRKRNVSRIEELIQRDEVNENQRVSSLENYLRKLERRRQKMKIVSPLSGIVSDIYAFEGDLFSAGQPFAVVISDERVIEVRISEENFTGVEVGQEVRVKLLGYENEDFKGEVRKVMPVADPATQRYAVHVGLAVDRSLLFPGLTGEASIIVDQRKDALVLPTAALLGDYVYVARNNEVQIVQVRKGYENMRSVEIVDGLAEGDLVIVGKLDTFREGDAIRTKLLSSE